MRNWNPPPHPFCVRDPSLSPRSQRVIWRSPGAPATPCNRATDRGPHCGAIEPVCATISVERQYRRVTCLVALRTKAYRKIPSLHFLRDQEESTYNSLHPPRPPQSNSIRRISSMSGPPRASSRASIGNAIKELLSAVTYRTFQRWIKHATDGSSRPTAQGRPRISERK